MRKFFVAVLVCVIVIAGLALRAQTNSNSVATDTSAEPRIRTNGPGEIRQTEIHSDAARFLMKSNIYIYRGDVYVDNPQLQLWCELLTLEAPKLEHGNKYNCVTAETNVVTDFFTGTAPNLTTNHATSDKAVYTSIITNIAPLPAEQWQTSSVVVLSGHSVLTNNQGVRLNWDPIIWDRITDVMSTTNMQNTTINSGHTNNSELFAVPTPKSTKTSAPPK